MVSHGVCQSPYGIVKDQQVLVLILPKGEDQRVEDEAQVRNQLRAGLLLQGGKGASEERSKLSSAAARGNM